MKRKMVLFFVVCIFAAPKIFGQYLIENFDYPPGTLITTQGWVAFSGIGVNPIVTKDPGLVFPCYAGSGIGGTATLQTTGEDVYKFLPFPISTGSVYVSFMVKVYTAQDGDFFFHLGNNVVNNANKIGRVYVKAGATPGMVAFGLGKNNEDPAYTPAQYSTNTDYLLVLKYTFVTGNDNDLVSLFVFSPPTCLPSVEPAPNLGPLGVGENDLPDVGKIVLVQGAGGHAAFLQVDGIYVDNSWDNGALPVELSSFTSAVNQRDATLNWTTVTESNNSGFNIERQSSVSNEWKEIGNVAGNGTSNNSHSYTFTDRNLESGKYSYRLKQVDFNGNFEFYYLSSEVLIGNPTKFDLSQNYPNPFNPSTKINYDLPSDGYTSLKVYNMSGKEVATLINGNVTAGYHSVNFNASELASGVYYYKLESNGFSKVMKMALIK